MNNKKYLTNLEITQGLNKIAHIMKEITSTSTSNSDIEQKFYIECDKDEMLKKILFRMGFNFLVHESMNKCNEK